MISPQAFLKLPIDFNGICTIYPPSVNDVITNPFDDYFSILTLSQDTIEEEFTPLMATQPDLIMPTPFEYLLVVCAQSDDFYKKTKEAFKFFLKEDVTFLWEAATILVGDLKEEIQVAKDTSSLRLLTDKNFLAFQDAIRGSCGKAPYKPLEDLSNLPARAREMKLKARERDRVKAKQDAKKAPSLETCLVSICCMGVGLTPLNIGEISYASVGEIIETNQRHEKYSSDCWSIMLGADPKKIKLEY